MSSDGSNRIISVFFKKVKGQKKKSKRSSHVDALEGPGGPAPSPSSLCSCSTVNSIKTAYILKSQSADDGINAPPSSSSTWSWSRSRDSCRSRTQEADRCRRSPIWHTENKSDNSLQIWLLPHNHLCRVIGRVIITQCWLFNITEKQKHFSHV